MWIKLTSIQYISVNGKLTPEYPGNWVDVGKQTALRWVAEGNAELADYSKLINMNGVGLVLLSGAKVMQILSDMKTLLIMHDSVPTLAYPKTILVGAKAKLKPGLLPPGINLLKRWQLAVPLVSYKTLAADIGTEEEREQAKADILDLRVPIYQTDLMFVRRSPETRELFDVWNAIPGNRHLAFLRALWKVKPLICALPVSWWTKDDGRK